MSYLTAKKVAAGVVKGWLPHTKGSNTSSFGIRSPVSEITRAFDLALLGVSDVGLEHFPLYLSLPGPSHGPALFVSENSRQK